MDAEKLQNLLNSNRIDVRQFNQTQRLFVDQLQKRGLIKTKPIAEIAEEQRKAREEVAKQKSLYQDPIKAMSADKLNREKVATYTDIGMFLGTILASRKSAAKLLFNPKAGIQELAQIKSNFKNPTLNKFFTSLKQIKAIAQGAGPSLSNAAVRGVIGGTTGYVGGALAYDLADEIVRDLNDLKKLKGDKTYKEMMEKNQLVRSLDDLRIGLTFNASAELLGPFAAKGMYFLRKGFGLETEYSRALAQFAKTNNLDANYIMLADPNTVGGKVLKTINRVFGQLPGVGGPAKQAQIEAIEKFNIMSQNAFAIQPGMHLATLASASEKVANQILKRYEQFRNLTDIQFNRVYDMAKSFGDPRFIDLTMVNNVFKQLENSAFAPIEVKNALRGFELKTPLGNFIDAYKRVASGGPISVTEYVELRKLLNQTTAQMNKNDPLVATFKSLQTALETDFAKANLDAARDITLRFPIRTTEQLTKSGGAVQQEVRSTLGDIKFGKNEQARLKETIEDAFKFYANNVQTFESRTARIASAFDTNALSLKQIQGFKEAGNIEKDQIINKLSKGILQLKSNFSFDAITDLQKLVDADVYKIKPITDKFGQKTFETQLVRKGTAEGNKTLEELWGAHVGDAYQLSFRPLEKDSVNNWIKSLFARESDIALNTGMYKNLNELRGPNGLPINNIGKGNLVFDPDIFRKLILQNEAAATQFRVIFGAQKGNKLLKQYDEFLSYMDSVRSYVVPDPSTFLARRLVLTGGATSVAAYGLGVIPTFLMLMLGRYANKILANPKAMENINAPLRSFLENPGAFGGFSTQTRVALSKLGNYFLRPETGITYDESDVSMREMHNFFKDNDVSVTKPTDLNMNKEEMENLYPTMTEEERDAAINDLPPPDDLFARIGGMPANVEEERMMASALAQLSPGTIITPTTLPRQQGLRIPGPGVQAPDYSDLFPFDPVGNLIAARRKV